MFVLYKHSSFIVVLVFLTVDYVARLSYHSSTVVPIRSLPMTSPSADLASSWLALHVGLALMLGLSIASIVIVLIIFIRCLCSRSPMFEYPTIQYAHCNAQQGSGTGVPESVPALPNHVSEESTDAAAHAAAGSLHHRYAPSTHNPQPFNGFQQISRQDSLV